jgi:hypothetical protein
MSRLTTDAAALCCANAEASDRVAAHAQLARRGSPRRRIRNACTRDFGRVSQVGYVRQPRVRQRSMVTDPWGVRSRGVAPPEAGWLSGSRSEARSPSTPPMSRRWQTPVRQAQSADT